MLFSLKEMLLLCFNFYISGSFIHILVLVLHIKFMLFKEAACFSFRDFLPRWHLNCSSHPSLFQQFVSDSFYISKLQELLVKSTSHVKPRVFVLSARLQHCIIIHRITRYADDSGLYIAAGTNELISATLITKSNRDPVYQSRTTTPKLVDRSGGSIFLNFHNKPGQFSRCWI